MAQVAVSVYRLLLETPPFGCCSHCPHNTLTRVTVCGHNGEDGRPSGDILVDLLGVAEWIKHRCVVVQVQHVAVDGESGRETGVAVVLRLDD